MDDILNIVNNKSAINIVLGVIGTVLLIFFFKKRKQNLIASKSNDKALDSEQVGYLAKKNGSKEEELTIKQKLELSWNFLYEIAEIVLNKFSPEDKAEIQELGKDLAKAGMKYQHIIDLALNRKESRVESLKLKQDKSDQGRGL